MKFVATVVLYNPTYEVVENIKTYCEAVTTIYVVDNSDNTNKFVVECLESFENIEYINLGDNKGIAHALNIALERAMLDKADYLLTMDQDTAFRGEDANKMVLYIENCEHRGEIALYAANTDDYTGKKEIEYVKLALTSGNMINCRFIKSIGGFDEALFIDWVDQDICYRILKAGGKIAKLCKVKINHHLGENKEKCVFGIKYTYITHNSLRYYYMTRNKFYVLMKNNITYKKRVVFFIGTIQTIIRVMVIEDNKWLKLKYILKGWIDFVKRKMGKIK